MMMTRNQEYNKKPTMESNAKGLAKMTNDENVLEFVVDVLSNPPHDDKYETLKNVLLNRLTDTEKSRLKKLLTDMELGDRHSSDLLRQMKSLAGSSISDELIKSLWLQRLPQKTQAILSISKDSLNNIAEMADKIIAVYSSSEGKKSNDIRAETVADNILKGWISRFGTPLVITTTQGTQFEAQLFQELSKLIGFKRNKTTTYYPQANGCIERWHHFLKTSIMCHESESWARSLPIILLGMRTIWRADFEATPTELLYGESIRLPRDFFEDTLFQPQSEFVQTLKATIRDFKPVPFSYHSKQKLFIFKDRKDRSHVFVLTDSVRRSLQSPYHGPYKIETMFFRQFCIGEDTPNKPAEMLVKKIRFDPLLLPTSTRATRGGR
ncbi:putative gag-pol protein [Trichonephila clavipes]|nr:putative gag-pol protein [Trichonephila clavipes]